MSLAPTPTALWQDVSGWVTTCEAAVGAKPTSSEAVIKTPKIAFVTSFDVILLPPTSSRAPSLRHPTSSEARDPASRARTLTDECWHPTGIIDTDIIDTDIVDGKEKGWARLAPSPGWALKAPLDADHADDEVRRGGGLVRERAV